MTIDKFLAQLKGVKPQPRGYLALCPAHNDRRPSLSVTETGGRILIYCWAACPTKDVSVALGLTFSDLFLDGGKTKGTTWRTGPGQPERVPRWNLNWRSQCGELERLIQEKREDKEAILQAAHGLDVNSLTADEFDELWSFVGGAYAWLERCGRLDEMLFDLQQTLRAEERAQCVKAREATA